VKKETEEIEKRSVQVTAEHRAIAEAIVLELIDRGLIDLPTPEGSLSAQEASLAEKCGCRIVCNGCKSAC
jgi:hypothetical protein